MNDKINCKEIKQLLGNQYKENMLVRQNNILCRKSLSTLEVHEKVQISDNMLLDIRTYICAHGNCLLQHNRSHRRISNYNWEKMLKSKIDINAIAFLANSLITTTAADLQENMVNNAYPNITIKSTNNKNKSNPECVFCFNTKLNGIKHIHFVKEE